MSILANPYALGGIAVALLLSHGWAFNQGRHFEQWQTAAAIEATNKLIRTVNARETELTAKEDELRDRALSDARPVLLAAGKCPASPDVAAALNRIR